MLIPYKIKDNTVFVFLQKRDMNPKVLPGHFSFFGGKIEEGETPEQALEREIQEELSIDLKGYQFFRRYPSFKGTEVMMNFYIAQVGEDFEKEITVMEGEYGKFFSQEEVEKEPLLIDHDKGILRDLYRVIKNKKEL